MKYALTNGIFIPANEYGEIRLFNNDEMKRALDLKGLIDGTKRRLDFVKKGMLELVGFLPDEGEALFSSRIWNNIGTDRGTNSQLGLFTNVSPGETITHATITEPTGTGYARFTLLDANWTGAGDTRSYATQTFTAGAGGWTGSVQGYFINSLGTTNRLMGIEVDASGPYTFTEGDSYDVTPNNRAA